MDRSDESLRLPPGRALLVFTGLVAAVASAALLLPPGLGAIAIVAGFVAGAVFERYRQDHLPLPPSLAETPAAWGHKLRDEIGLVPALASLFLIAAALTVVSLSTGTGGPQAGDSPAADSGVRAGPLPDLAIREAPFGSAFEAAGATFRVTTAEPTGWAASLPAESGAARRWLALAVDVNATAGEIDPAALSFRLADGRGGLYYPEQQGTVGPSSLTDGGFLHPGQSAEVRLAFLAPVAASGLALEFEPRPGGASKTRVGVP